MTHVMFVFTFPLLRLPSTSDKVKGAFQVQNLFALYHGSVSMCRSVGISSTVYNLYNVVAPSAFVSAEVTVEQTEPSFSSTAPSGEAQRTQRTTNKGREMDWSPGNWEFDWLFVSVENLGW